MKRRPKRLLGIAAAIALSSLGGAFAFHNLHSEQIVYPQPNDVSESDKPLMLNGSELVVRAFELKPSTSAPRATRSFTGSLQPRYLSSVGFRVAGKISERNVELGQRVKKGDSLFKLDPIDAELQLRVSDAELISAKSLVKQATAEESRLARLRSSGSVSQSDYDLALSARDVALSRLESAERRLTLAQNQRQYCDLKADEDGLVTSVQAETGQVVNIGQPVFQLMTGRELEAVVSLPESMLEAAKRCQATAVFWSRPSLKLRAEIREMSPVADAASRTYDTKFRLLDSTDDLAIGMTVTVQLSDANNEGMTIPLSSITSRGKQSIVWRIVAKHERHGVEAVPVKVMQYGNDSAMVESALMAGDRIVNGGVQRVDEHSVVRVWEAR